MKAIVVVVHGGVVPREVLEGLGAMVLETRDPALLVRHIVHAFANPWPEVDCGSGLPHEPEPPTEIELALERAIFARDLLEEEEP